MEVVVKAVSSLGYTAIFILCAIASIFTISFFTMLNVSDKYHRLKKDLTGAAIRKDKTIKNKLLYSIVEDYRIISMAAKGEVNTRVIIEKNLDTRLKGLELGERFVKSSVLLMIVLGLLGTFYELSLSLGSLLDLLNTGGSSGLLTSRASIIAVLTSSLGEMSKAFYTGLAGIGASILIAVMGIALNIKAIRHSFIIQLEDYLDNVIEQELLQYKESELSRISMAIIASFDGFSSKVGDILRTIAKNNVETVDMSDFTEAVRQAAAAKSCEK